jgi:hypothetical protein
MKAQPNPLVWDTTTRVPPTWSMTCIIVATLEGAASSAPKLFPNARGGLFAIHDTPADASQKSPPDN